MKPEAKLKTIFKKSVKANKGHCISLAAPMISGIPDLYVLMPGYMPVLMEAKWLGEITKLKFKRKVPYSEMQLHWMRKCNQVEPYTAVGLVGLKHMGLTHCIIDFIHNEKEHFITEKHLEGASMLMNGLFNINMMYRAYGMRGFGYNIEHALPHENVIVDIGNHVG